MPDPLQSLRLMFFAGGILALSAGVVVLFLYLRSGRPSLFPRSSAWIVPWNGWAVLIAFVVVMVLPSLVQALLNETRLFQALYGDDFPSAKGLDDDGDPTRKQAAHLRGLWSQLLAVPLQIAVILIGFHQVFRANLPQFGLSRNRFSQNVVLGYLVWLFITPLTFGIFLLAVLLFAPNPGKHPLLDLGPWAGQRELVIFALQAAILTPILEELVFRGILLPWLLQEPRPEQPERDLIVPIAIRPHVCYAASLFLCLQSPTLADAMQRGNWKDVLSGLAPVYFLIALFPLYFFLPFRVTWRRRLRLGSPHMARAWLANAILFAAVHASVWPSPVPLFFLSLGLAWLAIRTRSIIPCIVVHALFNGLSVVYLSMGGPL
ncbi:MAG: CPBP family intramembrane metalloprotease [Planctomycetes bacterium]|nr:CPBP family intramembrane metalloprotease [Planctomycetota bacterium]